MSQTLMKLVFLFEDLISLSFWWTTVRDFNPDNWKCCHMTGVKTWRFKQKSFQLIYKCPKLIVFKIFFIQGTSPKAIFSCHYPFWSVQRLRIFGNGQKIRNVHNIPIKLIKAGSKNPGIPYSLIICASSFTAYCLTTNTDAFR